MAKDIDVKELKEKMDRGDDFLLIDVREPHEHQEFNVGGQLIPLGALSNKIEALKPHAGEEIILYCRSGNRSGMAKQLMEQSGFKVVRNLLGGMLDWEKQYGVHR